MATRSAIREQVSRLIRDYPRVDTLAAQIDAAATTLTLTRGTHAGAPALMEVDDEIIDIGAWTAGTKTASDLIRGAHGTTGAQHLIGAQVRFGWRVSRLDYNEAINSAIRRMNAAGLYQITTKTLTYNASIGGYALDASVVGIAEVRADTAGPGNEWPIVRSWELVRDMPTSDFASTGIGLVIGSNLPQAGFSVQVKQKKLYAMLTSDAHDTLTTGGIQAFAEDIPRYGAASELFGFEEAGRTQINNAVESQRAQDVPPRHRITAAQVLEAKFEQRISEAKEELRKLYPLQTRKVPL